MAKRTGRQARQQPAASPDPVVVVDAGFVEPDGSLREARTPTTDGDRAHIAWSDCELLPDPPEQSAGRIRLEAWWLRRACLLVWIRQTVEREFKFVDASGKTLETWKPDPEQLRAHEKRLFLMALEPRHMSCIEGMVADPESTLKAHAHPRPGPYDFGPAAIDTNMADAPPVLVEFIRQSTAAAPLPRATSPTETAAGDAVYSRNNAATMISNATGRSYSSDALDQLYSRAKRGELPDNADKRVFAEQWLDAGTSDPPRVAVDDLVRVLEDGPLPRSRKPKRAARTA